MLQIVQNGIHLFESISLFPSKLMVLCKVASCAHAMALQCHCISTTACASCNLYIHLVEFVNCKQAKTVMDCLFAN